MPALPSFIYYRPGKKAKAAIRSPFSLLRGDSSTASSSTSHQPSPLTPDVVDPTVADPEVIDINHTHYSDGGHPSASFDDHSRSSSQLNLSTSPQVELDIDLSSNGLSDWLEAFSSGDPKKEAKAKKRLSRLIQPGSLNAKIKELTEEEGEADRGLEDMVATPQTVVVSCKV